ncbi:MAG: hypothetical protein J6C16_02780, partial [Clostridia bacterium]|nr:hypothetical protein [Clostridia bacterium]
MKKTTKKIIASALAAAMVMASSAMTFADTTGEAVSTGDAATTEYEALTKCSYTSEMTVDGKVATVTISVDGDVSAFDFGLM